MNNDLISREALKEAVEELRRPKAYSEADVRQNVVVDCVLHCINNAPIVEPFERIGVICEENCGYRPQGEWIPVSDRLPEYSGLYLISIYDLVTVANFTGKHFCDRQMDNFVDVIAWQPLPKPYKKGGAE